MITIILIATTAIGLVIYLTWNNRRKEKISQRIKERLNELAQDK